MTLVRRRLIGQLLLEFPRPKMSPLQPLLVVELVVREKDVIQGVESHGSCLLTGGPPGADKLLRTDYLIVVKLFSEPIKTWPSDPAEIAAAAARGGIWTGMRPYLEALVADA